ncbi:MAG: hypothetical protein MJ169_05575 [Treponema sp.]|nr:hypothetical protein [Treponema sp.]
MATFDFVVDTTPMAESVSSVSGHVAGTTAAVVAMESAVIRTEEEAAANICKNVTTGFHVLMQSQVSQKAAAYFSQMSSKMVLLMEFAKSLGTTQNRMFNDFQRLKREYTKIFTNLDKALENRIRQLDKYAMELGDVKRSLVVSKIVKDAPAALFYGRDTQNANQMMFGARIKSKVSKALDNMAANVYSTQTYMNKLDSVLNPAAVSENTTACIPVVVTEEKSTFAADSIINNVYVSEGVGSSSKSTIENTVMANFSDYISHENSQAENSEIKNEFMKLVAASGLDDRVSKQIVALFDGGSSK